jgi:endonuclease/exonuclease/phosphatase family metal-dependent hydrolase
MGDKGDHEELGLTRRRVWARNVCAPLAIASALTAPATATATLASAAAAPADANDAHRFITVMTQNLDQGTDFTPLFTATSGPAFLSAASAIFDQVVASDILGRARLVAHEIAAAMPDVVSLQEASLWQWQSPIGPASIDALNALERALAAEGAHYAPVSVLAEFSGVVQVQGFGQVTFLDRDALLVRTDQPPARLRVGNVQRGHYATMLSIPTVAGTVTVPRGWISADLTVRRRKVRVIATHLERSSAAVQQAQGGELLAGPASTPLPVIIAGDLNTGPLASGGFVSPTYQRILESGFTDTWPATNPGVAGLTNAFHAQDPYGPAVPDKRIDLVLVNRNLRSVSGTLTGTSPVDGLWPSDHAGVVARIRIS